MRRAAEQMMARLSAQPSDLVWLWREATKVLAPALPHWHRPCWYTLDPASLLMTSHFHEGLAEFPREWLASEYYDDDVKPNRGRGAVAGGDLDAARSHRRPAGGQPALAPEHDNGRRPRAHRP